MRLAWFSPWPPQASGIAGRSHVAAWALARAGFGVDVFVDERVVPVTRQDATPPEPGRLRVHSAHDFVWRQTRGHVDLAVYQLGNSRLHDYIWPYLFRWPGLAVLHDARLLHARGHALLSRGRADAFRAEFAFDHPDTPPGAAELTVAGFDGEYDALWPMTRAAVAASRLTAAHTRGGAQALAAACPEAAVEYIALGEGRQTPLSPAERRAARAALGLGGDDVAVGVFGALTADKRVPEILRAFAAARRHAPRAQLILAGAADTRIDVPGLAAALRITDAVTVRHDLDDAAFDRAIGAVDACVQLRWPTAVETSGPWLRALAAGLPTIVIALAHQAHVPSLDPRDWTASHPGTAAATIALDILDEDHSLTVALRRLLADADLRASLGAAGRRYWEKEHTETRMIDDYQRVIAHAAALPDPPARLPPHLRPDPAAHVADVLAPFPDVPCALC